MNFESYIRNIPDFPRPGIQFKDITPLIARADAFAEVINKQAAAFANERVDVVVGIESRGFIFGSAVAIALHAGFVPVRRPGKLPHATYSVGYALEYGQNELHIHTDALKEGSRVLIVDDLLATGGTVNATIDLVEKAGGFVVGCSFVVELDFLNGRERLGNRYVHSLVHY